MNQEFIIEDDAIQEILKDYRQVGLEMNMNAFNLATVGNLPVKYELFHSEILYSLLNPKGLHGKGSFFLLEFIKFIRDYHNSDVDPSNFLDSDVTKERGRIDIWIKDRKSRHSIIIENKMNDAQDQERQIDNYFEYVEYKELYFVKSIIYLSKDGVKTAPSCENDLIPLIKNVGAYTNKDGDLVSGWFVPIINLLSIQSSDHSYSFLQEYIKILKQISINNMENSIKQKFMDIVYSKNNALEQIDALCKIKRSIPNFRRDKFNAQLPNIKIVPFNSKNTTHSGDAILLEGFHENTYSFKLDIYFYESGSAEIVFWIPTLVSEKGKQVLVKKLDAIGQLGQFKTNEGEFKYRKEFSFEDKFLNIADLDLFMLKFINDFLEKLRN